MNHAPYIRRSFLSATEQTYPHTEFIYLDNFSSDESFALGEEILRVSGKPVQSFRRDRSFGISANLNFLLRHASGEYITILSADDWWDVNNLQKKIPFFQANNNYGLLHGAGFVYYHATEDIEVEKPLNTASGWLLEALLKRNFINTIGVIIPKSVFEQVGEFDEASPIEDWDMWIRIAEKFPILYFPEPLVYYGKTAGGNLSENQSFMSSGYAYLFDKYKGKYDFAAAKDYYRLEEMYQQARAAPSWEHLTLLAKNFRLSNLHIRQMIRCLAGILAGKK